MLVLQGGVLPLLLATHSLQGSNYDKPLAKEITCLLRSALLI